ncbi:ATP-binding cassette sub- G member 1 [Dionaea muscipula]
MHGSSSVVTDSPQAAGAVPRQVQPLPPRDHDNHQLGSGGGGVFLTWKDLWVKVAAAGDDHGKEGRQRTILEGVTGYAQPGEVLAIMGPSGCGKSTLLDALAGRLGSNIRKTGEILANGRKKALTYATNSAYVTQDDSLMSTLSVREAVYYSAELQLPRSMSKREKLERADMVIKEMGLQDSTETRIGGWSKGGISGGQRRRVSICIEILTRPRLLFLDEPTSGLDSAASYHVMSRIIKLAEKDRRTIIASIHQPGSEVFELFHNLCLLSCGRLVYFGPTLAANKFFADSGFPCPSFRNPSDHYLRTINNDFDLDAQDDIEKESSGRSRAQDAINFLVMSYEFSEIYHQVQHRVQLISQQGGEMIFAKKGSESSFINQSIVLTRRSFVNMYRDLGYYWLRFGIYIAICLCIGTIFLDIGNSPSSIQARASMLNFVANLLTLMAIGSFPSFVEDMKIFQRERLNGHYGVGAYVIGNTLSSIPFLIINTLIPGVIAYYLVGLQRGFTHFVYFAMILYAAVMLVESLMMVIASVVPDFLMGIISGAGLQGVTILTSGFYRLPDDIPKPLWKYPMYYISFNRYAAQGLYKNEFQGLIFATNQVGGPAFVTGDQLLRESWQMDLRYSKWFDIAVLAGMVVAYRLIFYGIIKAHEKLKPVVRSFVVVKSGCLR